MDLLLKASNIHVEFLDKDILNIPSIEIYGYDRIGIVGENGVGKSTLLKVLNGELKVNKSKVQIFGEIAYFEQLKYVDINEEADNELLGRLGINGISHKNMSGGEQIKYRVANLLSREVHGIFADEPTCNIDKEGIDYLIKKFNSYQGALIIVSHDRYFLDSLVSKIWELKDGQITEYYGNYTDYKNQLEEKYRSQEMNYQLYTKEVKRLSNVYNEKVKKAEKVSKKPSQKTGKRNIPNKNDMTKSFGSREKTLYRSAKNVMSRIDNMEKVERMQVETQIKFQTNLGLELHNKYPIQGKSINKKFDNRIILQNADFTIPLGAKVAITGANGVGKTTLLNMILSLEEGMTVSPKAVIGHFAQNCYYYEGNETLIGYVSKDCDYKEAELRAMLISLGFTNNDLKKKVVSLSGGERVKCMLCKILAGRYNILIVDEPSNYLDLRSILALEKFMKDYKGTIIFVSHDEELVNEVADVIYKIDNYKIEKIRDNFLDWRGE